MSDRGGYGGSRGGGGRGGHRGPPPPRPRAPTLRELWPDYLSGGYFDADGNLRPEFVCRDKTGRLAAAMRDSLSSSQVRRYFGHCRAIETRLKSVAGVTWANVLPKVKMLDAAASDGKAKNKIPDIFYEFIKSNVAAIKTEEDFVQGFLPHFEAIMGFGAPFKER